MNDIISILLSSIPIIIIATYRKYLVNKKIYSNGWRWITTLAYSVSITTICYIVIDYYWGYLMIIFFLVMSVFYDSFDISVKEDDEEV